MDALQGMLMLTTPCPPAGCYLRFQFVSSWSLASGAESSSELPPTWKNTQPLHSPGTGQVGQDEQGVVLEGGLGGAVKVLCVPSPGAQLDGMGAGAPTSQALSQWEEQVGKHQSSLAKQAQVWARPWTAQFCPHWGVSHTGRNAGAQAMTIGVFRTVPYEALFCCLSNTLGTCTILRVICLKPRQAFVAGQGNTPSSPEALANTITAPTSFLFSPSSRLGRISSTSHQRSTLWSLRDGAVRGIAIRQLSLKWGRFDH